MPCIVKTNYVFIIRIGVVIYACVCVYMCIRCIVSMNEGGYIYIGEGKNKGIPKGFLCSLGIYVCVRACSVCGVYERTIGCRRKQLCIIITVRVHTISILYYKLYIYIHRTKRYKTERRSLVHAFSL